MNRQGLVCEAIPTTRRGLISGGAALAAMAALPRHSRGAVVNPPTTPATVDAARASYSGIQNVNRTNTMRTAAALARVRQGVGNATFGFVGDSYTRGQGSSATLNQLFINAFPKQIAERLPANLNAQWQSGFGSGTSSLGTLFTNDARWTQTGGFTGSTLSGVGGALLGANGVAGSMTFTPLKPTTKCDLWYLQNTTGVFSWQIDGGAATQISQAGSKAVVKTTIGTGAAANHAYKLNWVSGNVVVVGMNAYDDTNSRLDMLNFGRGGAASNYYSTDTDAFWSALPMLVDFACDTYFLGLAPNDWWVSAQNIPVPQYVINMQIIITALKAVGDVVLYSEITQDPSIATPEKQRSYVEALRGLALTNNCVFLDVWTQFQSYAVANGFGLMADIFHPSAAGNSLSASLFLNFINSL